MGRLRLRTADKCCYGLDGPMPKLVTQRYFPIRMYMTMVCWESFPSSCWDILSSFFGIVCAELCKMQARPA